MTDVVFLDTGVLGVVTHPRGSTESKECIEWMQDLLKKKIRVCVAEVCDYELRRKYIQRSAAHEEARVALSKLDSLIGVLDYIPVDTRSMREAAQMWATARNSGKATAGDQDLDIDVILCAQAKLVAGPKALMVATTNVRHLKIFVSADSWRNVRA